MAQDNNRKPGRPTTGVKTMRYFRMSHADYQLVQRAASASSQSTSAFIRTALLAKARQVLGEEG